MIGTSLSTTVAYCAGRSYGVHFRSALCAAGARRRTTMRSTTAASAEEREYMGPSLAVTGLSLGFVGSGSTSEFYARRAYDSWSARRPLSSHRTYSGPAATLWAAGSWAHPKFAASPVSSP